MGLDERQQERYQLRAKVMKALAHPTRLFVIDELGRGERCVCELQAEIGADMSTVSKHLALLREAGLIAMDKRGTQVYYSLRATCVPRLLDCVESVVRDNARRQLEMIR
jgi:ArsR family transcriptional regulator